MTALTLAIAHTWDGAAVADLAAVQLAADADPDVLLLRVLAPLHGDPPPHAPPGPTDRLWEHEVVEAFVAGPGERYLEVELGPHGHHLVLRLDGVRRPVASGLPLDVVTRRSGSGAWAATARVPRAWLPPGPHRVNAYRIHGPADARRYLAHTPTLGAAPDFHRLERFVPAQLPARPGPLADELVALVAAASGASPEVARASLTASGAPDDAPERLLLAARARCLCPPPAPGARDDGADDGASEV